MSANKNKTDALHDLLPKLYRSRTNQNWRGLIAAIGESDQFLADLLEQVRRQFFIKTSSRPYLDRLGSNVKVERPRFVGMDDPTFRKYIPVVSYQPKQVKLILDQLLDLFFFKESTTAYTGTEAVEPFTLEDGWELIYRVDALNIETVIFQDDDFSDISNATAEEIAGAINKRSQYSYAVPYYDSNLKQTFVRLFTNTIGSKGSIEIRGGRADTALRFEGFIDNAGTGADTEWNITKVGDTMTFEYTGTGVIPNIAVLQDKDIAIIDLPNNRGSFPIFDVDISQGKFSFKNLLGTVGTQAQTADTDVRFITPIKSVVYTRTNRAVTWETQPGKITVEMPASPPVIRRSLIGSMHINGRIGIMADRVSDNEVELEDATFWPNAGTFIIEQRNEIKMRVKSDLGEEEVSALFNGRLGAFEQKYTFTGKSGDNLTGISPALPITGDLNEVDISTIARDTNHVMTIVTTTAHNMEVGEEVIVADSIPTTVGTPAQILSTTANGTFPVLEVVDPVTLKVRSVGDEGTATVGTLRIERAAMAPSGSRLVLLNSQDESFTQITGPYIWDLEASFVLSSKKGSIVNSIQAGTTVKQLDLNTNNIDDDEGEIIFNYGTKDQEGPVKFLYKPTDNIMILDPAYIFEKSHDANSSIIMINHRGPHEMSGRGTEYAPYVLDPAVAREVLQEIITSVKSVGIFIEFLIRFPQQLYATIDVYQSGVDPG